jgi:hypothetical protein
MHWKGFLVPGLSLLIAGACFAIDRPGKDPEPPWRELELMLEQEGIDTSSPSLLKLARAKGEASNRWVAIEILGLRGAKEAIAVFREILVQEQDQLLRETAALALARLSDEVGLTALREFVHDQTEWSRQLYLAARLAELGDSTGYPYVAAAARAKSAEHRFSSVAPLVAFLPFSNRLPTDPIDLLFVLGRDEEAKVRREVLIKLPLATVKGVSPEIFCPLVDEMADGDKNQEIREMAALFRAHGAFQACDKRPGGTERP